MERIHLYTTGALTDGAEKLDRGFEKWLLNNHSIDTEQFIVSGKSYRTIENIISRNLARRLGGVFACEGSEVWSKGNLLECNHMHLTEEQIEFLNKEVQNSSFLNKSSRFIENRSGVVSYSTVGFAATPAQRSAYIEFDRRYRDRQKIVEAFNSLFKDTSARIAGETSINVCMQSKGKERIAKYFDKMNPNSELHVYVKDTGVVQFGCEASDSMMVDILQTRNRGKTIINKVRNWRETWDKLRKS